MDVFNSGKIASGDIGVIWIWDLRCSTKGFCPNLSLEAFQQFLEQCNVNALYQLRNCVAISVVANTCAFNLCV